MVIENVFSRSNLQGLLILPSGGKKKNAYTVISFTFALNLVIAFFSYTQKCTLIHMH